MVKEREKTKKMGSNYIHERGIQLQKFGKDTGKVSMKTCATGMSEY
jgi:hypothetical protein